MAQAKVNGKPLRFAALIRVSTEKQEQKGESLRTQTSHIQLSVEYLNGTIVAWYGGQEHATPGYEKQEVDRLIGDAARNTFDAVIVYQELRWSRDNAKSKEGLNVFRQNNKRFFVGMHEYDLFNPQHKFNLGMAAEIGELNASTQSQQSLMNRIERAKRGIPTCGKLPIGRTFEKDTEQWGIDAAKLAMIEDAAKRYLKGEPMAKLAKEYGVNHSNLHKTLTQRCGDNWDQHFACKEFNLDVTVSTVVPRLLSEKTIKAIHQRVEANKTYEHGRPKHDYLLAGRIFCGVCGYSMFGQTNHGDRRYYRHAHTERARECSLRPRPWVQADAVEGEVIGQLFAKLGNPKAIERAIEAAIPNREKVTAMRTEIEGLNQKLKRIQQRRERILRFIDKEAVTEAQAEKNLFELQAEETAVQAEMDGLAASLENIPSCEAIRQAATHTRKVFHKLSHKYGPWLVAVDEEGGELDEDCETYRGGNDLMTLLEMTPDDRRNLIELAFGSPLPNGKPAGVYVYPVAGRAYRSKPWKLVLRGQLIYSPRAVGKVVMLSASS